MKITKEVLESKNACSPTLEQFAEMFPQGVEPTADLCEKHYRLFPSSWAAANLLSKSEMVDFELIRSAVRFEHHPSGDEYHRILARAFGALISGDRKEVESFPPLNTPKGKAMHNALLKRVEGLPNWRSALEHSGHLRDAGLELSST
jgi:hypothetical protein